MRIPAELIAVLSHSWCMSSSLLQHEHTADFFLLISSLSQWVSPVTFSPSFLLGVMRLFDDCEPSQVSNWGQSVCSVDPRTCLPRRPRPHVDNTPRSSWSADLCFSCSLLLASARCLTSRLDQSCHLHFTLTRPFPPISPQPSVPQVIYHPVWTISPLPPLFL